MEATLTSDVEQRLANDPMELARCIMWAIDRADRERAARNAARVPVMIVPPARAPCTETQAPQANDFEIKRVGEGGRFQVLRDGQHVTFASTREQADNYIRRSDNRRDQAVRD